MYMKPCETELKTLYFVHDRALHTVEVCELTKFKTILHVHWQLNFMSSQSEPASICVGFATTLATTDMFLCSCMCLLDKGSDEASKSVSCYMYCTYCQHAIPSL